MSRHKPGERSGSSKFAIAAAFVSLYGVPVVHADVSADSVTHSQMRTPRLSALVLSDAETLLAPRRTRETVIIVSPETSVQCTQLMTEKRERHRSVIKGPCHRLTVLMRDEMPRLPALCCCTLLLTACATIPGRDFARGPPAPLTRPPNPALIAPFAAYAQAHPEESGFRLFSVGVDGLLLRLELITQAHSSLDLQYYIFHGDESGRLITDALARAAARGVRVRILVDDGETVAGDEQLFALAKEPNVAIRVFNPWRYRGHSNLLRGVEFLFSRGRLDYRMHNKLFVADGAIALIGGRNIGDQYFQIDPQSQFADDDAFVTGPAVADLGVTFERFWNSDMAVPVQALLAEHRTDPAAAAALMQRTTVPWQAASAGFDYPQRLAANEPLASLLAGSSVLAWARAEVTCDPPDKGREIAADQRVSDLLFPPVAREIRATQSQLTIVTPYLVPTGGEMRLLEEQRAAQRSVRILTTSLEASKDPLAQAGYMHYRPKLLESGVQLFELRARPESVRGTGQSRRLSRYGNFSLHAKLLVFDRRGLFIGSMNFDQRSQRLNTEVGLIIHSPELAEAAARRFSAMTQPENAYAVSLGPVNGRDDPLMTWTTIQTGQPLILHREPARSTWQRLEVHFFTLMPLDREL
jgi:putative cardiolipin synthase